MRICSIAGAILTVIGMSCAAAPAAAPPMTLEQKEEFLLKAKSTGNSKGTSKGITGTIRITMHRGDVTHDVHVQRIDEFKPRFETPFGAEINFKDSWKYNVAAYRLGKMLGIGEMIPPSVPGKYGGSSAALTWWLDDYLMDEQERLKKHLDPPGKDQWARQTHIMRLFDQLIFNVDRNQGNILYDRNWNLYMIDHTRSFRIRTDLQDRSKLERCDRELMKNLKALDRNSLEKELKGLVDKKEIQALLVRRDLIVAHFEKAGPAAFYDWLKK